MSRRNISQREAHKLLKRVQELEEAFNKQRSKWSQQFFGGTHLGNIKRERDWFAGRLEAARELGNAIVCKCGEDGSISFYALPHGKP